ncbi:MAG: flippase activity-associated protein Agl23 [Anaerolineae bacterium]
MSVTAQDKPDRRVGVDLWKVAYVTILLVALVTRFYALGDRAVSHDETTHAKYSWNLYIGDGFRPDPLMHGPLLFQATALMYALFGVSDFTARLYTALTGIALVMSPLLFRRWLGRLGALVASLLLLISPAITYYSRYTRHDVPILLFSTLLLWSVMRYLADGESRWLRWMGVFFALMYVTKENAYIYTAIFLALMALPFVWYVIRTRWENPGLVPVALAILAVAALSVGVFALAVRGVQFVAAEETGTQIGNLVIPWWGNVAAAVLMVAGLGLVGIVTRGVGERRMRSFRLFDVLMALGSLTLILGAAALMKFVAGVDMATFYQGMMVQGLSSIPAPSLVGGLLMLFVAVGLGVVLGLWWNRKIWPLMALAHYAVLFVFYTTFFTYGMGLLTGLVGGLMYWLGQQGVDRGSQPWYYYGFIGPLYEYLALLVSMLGGFWLVGQGVVRWLRARSREHPERGDVDLGARLPELFPYFLLGWAVLSWGAYIVAGEKMPWLFVHIAFPHILLAAWAIGRFFEGAGLRAIFHDGGWLVPISLFFLWRAWAAFQQSSGAVAQVLQKSGAGEELALTIAELQPLGRTFGGVIGILLFTGLLIAALNRVRFRRGLRLGALTAILLLGALTIRTMIMLNYINDELATEYLVYAHATPDVNEALEKIEQASWRLTGTPGQIQVAYGKDVAWPFYWYMYTRFPNNYYFEIPESERLLASPVIVAAKSEWPGVEEIVGSEYEVFDYKHIWWPVEDYRNLTWARIRYALTDPEMRKAVWDIIWERDYTRYALLKDPENPFTLKTWPHRSEFRLYVRRDLSARVWDYELEEGSPKSRAAAGALRPVAEDDPYAGLELPITSEILVDLPEASGQGLAVAPDGSLYVADAQSHRIWQVSADGRIDGLWGRYGVGAGQFYHPSDVAVDADGNVYVADTWNHRVQKFDPEGQPLLSWGRFAQAQPRDSTGYGAFAGPRGVAVGPEGNVFVTDTGNNRVQVFDADGAFMFEFGRGGDGPGEFREPAGIAISSAGEVFVADTWHRRIQVFNLDGLFLRQWEVPVWAYAQPDVRPHLAVNGERVIATDPAFQRLLVFGAEGELLFTLRDDDATIRPAAVATAGDRVYVTGLSAQNVFVYSLSSAP